MLRFLALALGLFLTAVVVTPSAPARPAADFAAPSVEGELLVKLKPQGLALSDEALQRRLGAPVLRRLDGLGVVVLAVPAGTQMRDFAGRVSSSPLVEYAEPNHRLKTAMVPSDPLFSGQTAYLNGVEATSAWDVELGSFSVAVAVLDSGIDLDHEDLAAKLWTNHGEVPDNGVDDDHNGCIDDVHGCSFIGPAEADPSCNPQPNAGVRDDNGHGTFVAGIIGAQGNNGLGIIGAAPGVSIMPVKILDCLGGGTAAGAAQGLLYAARMGARVANLSFGADGTSITLTNAIREAYNVYGMVIVTATGNDGRSSVTFPARLPETLAVGSSGTPLDPNARSPFSDWGPEVDVVAPGLNIISTVPANFCNVTWLCVQNGPYALASGTSFAAPLVSALVALIDSRTPNLSPDQVVQIIKQTAEPLPDAGTPGWAGAGRIRMRQSLNLQRFYLGAPGTTKQ
jgi:subtilisin family serine protease